MKLRKVLNIFLNLPLILGTILFLFPLFWMVSGSLQSSADIFNIPPKFFPAPPIFENYRELAMAANSIRWFFNSTLVSVLTTATVVIVSSMAGYSFAKKQFVGKGILFSIIALSIMVPRQILLVPLFTVVRSFNMIDTYAGLILPAVGWPLGIFLMRQFILTMPTDLLESAIIDGSGEIRTFIEIVLPIAKPAIGALAIFTFIDSWNDYFWQLLVTKSGSMYTLPLGIASLQQRLSTQFGLLMAGATISSLPTIILFIIFQGYFTKGITAGAIKG